MLNFEAETILPIFFFFENEINQDLVIFLITTEELKLIDIYIRFQFNNCKGIQYVSFNGASLGIRSLSNGIINSAKVIKSYRDTIIPLDRYLTIYLGN